MLRHNILLALRNFARYKSSFIINLIGLSTGLACTFLIYMWVTDELSVDKYSSNDDRLYCTMEFRKRATGIWTALSSPGPMAEALVTDIPEVEMAAQMTWPREMTVSVGENNFTSTGRYCAKDFFKIFGTKMLAGDPNTVITDKSSVAISDKLAVTLFGSTENSIGKTILLQHESEFKVTGVFQSLPINATGQFDFVLPYQTFLDKNDWLASWGNTGLMTIVLLKPGVDLQKLNAKLADFIKVKTNNDITYRTLFLKKFSDLYLYGQYDNDGVLAGGRITYVKLFSIIAVFILIIACINFMNLSTARATRRMKEVGIKKVMGAARKGLIGQYMGESIITSFISLAVAVLLVYVFLPEFNSITEKHLTFQPLGTQVLWFIGITLIAGILAGSYPALYLSGFSPAAVLKGKLSGSIGEVWSRKGLVGFQFTLSIIFIVSIIVVYEQIKFVQTADVGYNKENVVFFGLNGALEDTKKQELIINRIKEIPGVLNASSMGHNLAGHNGGTHGVVWEGKDPEDRTEFERFMVNYDLIETLGIEMAEGRAFSKDFATDTSAIIFNEKAIAFMGLTDPIGKVVKLWDTDRKIVGVVKDFHYESLHEDFKPIFMVVDPGSTWNVMTRFAAGKETEVVPKIEKLYREMNPGFDFSYQYLEENYKAQYGSEQRIATLSEYFGALAILISCLGLFGLASFTAERRLKEIGIRKVLGSSEMAIVYLLASDFTKIVLVSILIAVPISYFTSIKWLDGFAFKIALQPWYFIGAGLIALIVAWFTVAFQAYKASRVNPTDCLRSE
ncbi:MAG: ABC transporter permease [Bacteroidota bacterium]